MGQLNAYDVTWLTCHRDIVYANDIGSAQRIVSQRVNNNNGDKLLSVVLKNLPEITVGATAEERTPG